MPPAETAVVAARGLTKRFGAATVLRGVDLTIGARQVCLVLGENGSGKTTLLRLMAGLLRPTAGSLHLQGVPFKTSDVALRHRIGFLSHRSHLYDELSLRENLQFAARLYGLRGPDAVSQALALAQLEEKSGERVGRLSRGMQQRAALARAFIHRPALLLLDEPFTALDRSSADRIRQWIAERAQEKCAITIVTHQPEAIWDLATHVGVLANGQWAILEARPASVEDFQARYREAIRV
jgi:heme exporter protein A